MRSWIMQPGTMITHYESVKYAALSVLGAASLTVAVMAMLYTTAADALVQPQLKFGKWEDKMMMGSVRASFGNAQYLADQCQTPIQSDIVDGLNVAGSTCLQIEHASQGYHNYQRYMAFWDSIASAGNGSRDLAERPPGYGLLNENTTVTAQWIERKDSEDLYTDYGRIINNVSLAMPHAGVSAAARDARNEIVQPNELDGVGIYDLVASVPSPVIHVMCVNMNKAELAPIVWEGFKKSNKLNIGSFKTWSETVNWTDFALNNKTVVDKLFRWGEPDDFNIVQTAPVFAKYPIEYNTVANQSQFLYGRNSIYLLSKQGPEGAADAFLNEYSLCEIKVSMTAECSTAFSATGNGASLTTDCERPDNNMRYITSLTNATSGAPTTNKDWPYIGGEWINSLSLNAGMFDGNASNARLLTQLILSTYELKIDLPSIAEALAVMAGCTLLMSSADAPFVNFWV